LGVITFAIVFAATLLRFGMLPLPYSVEVNV
jgi:hypothetical protein